MKQPLPVIIEDLIIKVTNKNTHPEQRQHYVKTLDDIRKACNEAIRQYENERK
jgi:hypothetical protein